jgi:DNA polymerase V
MNSSTTLITDAVMELYDRIVNPDLLVRRINIVAGRVVPESKARKETAPVQLNLFYDAEAEKRREEAEEAALEREKRREKAVITIKKKYGKNAIIKGMNLEEGATAMDRNRQIGGHKA